MVLSKSGSRFPQLVDQAVGCGSRPIPMSMALSFMVSHTKHRMIPASFGDGAVRLARKKLRRSEEHTSELQSLMRISYAVFCLKKQITDPTSVHSIQLD